MERRLKERLIGASVLVMLAVIFIPMILDDTVHVDSHITSSNIPPRPEGGFTSRIVPLPANPSPGSAVPSTPAPGGKAPEAVMASPGPAPAPAETPPAKPSAAGPKPAASSPAATSGAAVAAKTADTKPQVPQVTPQTPAQGDQPDRVGLKAWVVQLGSFSSEENANSLNQQLRKAGYASFVEPIKEGNTRSYRVRVGPELLRSEAMALRDKLKSGMHLDGIVLTYP